MGNGDRDRGPSPVPPEWRDESSEDDAGVAAGVGPWSLRARDVAVALWSSFLSACFASLVFFSQVDPALIGDAMTPARQLTRMAGYGIGFFFFWLLGLIAAALTLYLVRTARPPDDARFPDGG